MSDVRNETVDEGASGDDLREPEEPDAVPGEGQEDEDE